jgi:hypothetical protein
LPFALCLTCPSPFLSLTLPRLRDNPQLFGKESWKKGGKREKAFVHDQYEERVKNALWNEDTEVKKKSEIFGKALFFH